MENNKINYAGGQQIYNVPGTEEYVHSVADPIAQDLVNEVTRATTEEQALQNRIGKLRIDLNKEIQDRIDGDTDLNAKLGDLADLETVDKSSAVAAINELVTKIPDIDAVLDDTSEHAVQNKAIKTYVDAADEHLQEQIDAIAPLDDVPTEGSEKGAKSGGIWDAIRFASVKVGETMFWPVSEEETREVHSDNPFTFRFKGQDITVVPQDGTVDMCISKNIPDGWHALDGTAVLDVADYPDLAAFMPDNVTTDGKIWLPYVQQKIIKVKY